jgi:hypothetical protein
MFAYQFNWDVFMASINGFDCLLAAIIVMVHHRKSHWKNKYNNRYK